MAQAKQLPVALVTGVGPGLGASLARRFAKDHAVALNARSAYATRFSTTTGIFRSVFCWYAAYGA